jgi:hypothetical protein
MGFLELTATASFGLDLQPHRSVAVTARGAEAHTEASPSWARIGAADDSWEG